MLLKVIGLAALAGAIAVAVVIFLIPTNTNPGVPNVRFTDFTADRIDITVGQTTNIVFNVQNLEDRAITDARVAIVIEPSGYQPYLSIDRPAIDLPDLQSRDARTGQMQATITANGAPAKEALYTVKGVLMVEGVQSDVREFELRIRQ
ncbi:MAG: hypothetical protein AB1351_06975 [Thermoproteota archaeon]